LRHTDTELGEFKRLMEDVADTAAHALGTLVYNVNNTYLLTYLPITGKFTVAC